MAQRISAILAWPGLLRLVGVSVLTLGLQLNGYGADESLLD